VKGIPMVYESSQDSLPLLKEEPVQCSVCARGLEFACYRNRNCWKRRARETGNTISLRRIIYSIFTWHKVNRDFERNSDRSEDPRFKRNPLCQKLISVL
jgi:hypothetical protein